jgi:hypothetical protein
VDAAQLTAAVDSNAAAPAQTRPAWSPRSGTRSLPIRASLASLAEPTDQEVGYERPAPASGSGRTPVGMPAHDPDGDDGHG